MSDNVDSSTTIQRNLDVYIQAAPDPDTQDEGEDLDASKYGDPSATFWKLYGSKAKINDKVDVESWKDNASSMVTLTTLFSVIIASFIIEIYKTLLPNNDQQRKSSPSSANPEDQSSGPSSVAVRINIVLFLSLFMSLMSAVACALIQQWSQEYMQYAYPSAGPQECGHIRTYLHRGLYRFHMRKFICGTHVLLHISLFLFFWAISDFFYTINASLGAVSRYCLVGSLAVYMLLSILPFIFDDCPYNTPLSNPIRVSSMLPLYGCRFVLRSLQRLLCDREKSIFPLTHRPYFKGLRFDKSSFLSCKVKKWAAALECYAMAWLFKENNLSDSDMDIFLEGLPGYISAYHTKPGQLYDHRIVSHILGRIREHVLTCATSLELSDDARISRALCCVKSLGLIFRHSIESVQTPSEKVQEILELQKTYIGHIIDDLCKLFQDNVEDPRVALRASCIMGIFVKDFLTQLAKSKGTRKPFLPFLEPLMPIYTFLQKDNIQDDWRNSWKTILESEGPLINLIVLANNIRSIKSTSSSSLSFCWKALDILLKQLRIPPTGVSKSILDRFNRIRDSTRKDIQKKQIFRMGPLLKILDTVVRGMRLGQALIAYPEYIKPASVIFEREPLRNEDFLEAFARCLPKYMANVSSEDGRKLMEDLVCDDDLWANLQVNLWDAQQSACPTTDKLPMFENCCTVMEVAFSSLEYSERVDWRAPKFGSLVQQFESFIAHYFQSSFMDTATSFHVGIIRAQYTKALLTQFLRDSDRDGTIFFRSQWDVASLARLGWALGIGDDKDAAFWQPYVNGGLPDEAFTCNAIFKVRQDGPLLIFHILGRLATTAVPLYRSGLENEHLRKVKELLRKVIDDQRLPLDRASYNAWEKLHRLRRDINDLYDNFEDSEDRDSMQDLLRMIDEVRPPGSQVPGSSERIGPITPTSPAWKQRPRVKLCSLSSSSDSTTFDEESSCATHTFEDIISNSETNTSASLSSPHEDDARLHGCSNFDQGNHTDRVSFSSIGTGSLCTLPVPPELHAPYSAHIRRCRTTPDTLPLRQSGSEFGISRRSPATLPRILTYTLQQAAQEPAQRASQHQERVPL